MPAPSAVSALQNANPAIGTVARANQTTVVPVAPGAPFTRQSRQAQMLGFVVSGQAFGATITQQLSAVGGYLRGLNLKFVGSGGNLSAATFAPDSPWNLINTLQFKDPTGQPLYQIDGYSLYLVNLLSGMCGQSSFQNPSALPSYSAPATATGFFTFALYVPLEFDSAAYCCLADMNAAAQPLLNIILAAQTAFYASTTGSTAPTIQLTVNELFWSIPQGNPQAAPPDVGSSSQWTVVNGGQNPTTSASLRVQHPSPGTYIHTLIATLRDSTNARINAFPTSDLTLWLDNVPLLSTELLTDRQDKIFKHFGLPLGVDQGVAAGNVKTVGVIAYTFRNSVQDEISSADDHDLLLPTTPATKLEIGGTWGTVTNAPAQLQFVTGWLYPANAQGIPYTHLAA